MSLIRSLMRVGRGAEHVKQVWIVLTRVREGEKTVWRSFSMYDALEVLGLVGPVGRCARKVCNVARHMLWLWWGRGSHHGLLLWWGCCIVGKKAAAKPPARPALTCLLT
jgi:hypothetical protein